MGRQKRAVKFRGAVSAGTMRRKLGGHARGRGERRGGRGSRDASHIRTTHERGAGVVRAGGGCRQLIWVPVDAAIRWQLYLQCHMQYDAFAHQRHHIHFIYYVIFEYLMFIQIHGLLLHAAVYASPSAAAYLACQRILNAAVPSPAEALRRLACNASDSRVAFAWCCQGRR